MQSGSVTPSTRPQSLCDTVVEDNTAQLEKGASIDIDTVEKSSSDELSSLRKLVILLILCSAQFLDIFNANAVIVSLPSLGAELGFSAGTLQWVLSAYTLTFAAFMLISGTISDIYHPKPIFSIGFAVVGLFSIPIGASVHPIMTIVFRAIQGIGAAMNVPSAISMIRTTFTNPQEQARAYGAYAMAGTIGNVTGFIIGGVLTATTSWRWVFYLIAIVSIPTSALAWFLLPGHSVTPEAERRGIDFPGVFSLTAGLILFVYAVSEGSEGGWGSPRVIVTLVLSIIMCAAFLVIESTVKNPALPPRIWSNKNFLALFLYAWSPYWWIFGAELQLIGVFMDLWHDSALTAALRCIPIGISGLSSYFMAAFVSRLHPSIFLVGGQVLMAVGAILFALADTVSRYWSFIVPGMIIGMIGLAAAYVACTTIVMQGARKGDEGIVGAVMYTAYQIGSTLGFAIVTSITIGVNETQPLDAVSQHRGYAASFWSLVGLTGIMFIIALFVRR
ncbi:hypothetical protein HGRIS_014322 [Hohenbuehelia grisea]|uniref:Major facilitator superfamily (MFS) profile domain-containing protein n=1 Tax=Hohenbuehelia grisea TaxID=104357 RepID=A0ABR3JUH1_9AGAR